MRHEGIEELATAGFELFYGRLRRVDVLSVAGEVDHTIKSDAAAGEEATTGEAEIGEGSVVVR